MENKKKVIVHINNASPEIKEALYNKYPDGYQYHVFKVTKPNNDFFYAVTVDTASASYLIKVDVKIDNTIEEKLSEQLFAKDDIPDTPIKDTDDDTEIPDKEPEEDVDDL
jgi:hypothetical protein